MTSKSSTGLNLCKALPLHHSKNQAFNTWVFGGMNPYKLEWDRMDGGE